MQKRVINQIEQSAIEDQLIDWVLQQIAQGALTSLQLQAGLPPGCVEGAITVTGKIQGHIRIVNAILWIDKYVRIRQPFTKRIDLGPCSCPSRIWVNFSTSQPIPFHKRIPETEEGILTLSGYTLKYRFYVDGEISANLKYCVPKNIFGALKVELKKSELAAHFKRYSVSERVS